MRKRVIVTIDLQDERFCRGCKFHSYGRCSLYDARIPLANTTIFSPIRCKECVETEKSLDN